MRIRRFLPAVLLPLAVYAQSDTATSNSETDSSASVTSTARGDVAQTTNVTYLSYTSTITRSGTTAIITGSSNATASTNGTTNSTSQTAIVGTRTSLANNGSTTASTAALPSNTQPCNGYVEFCDRSYANITYIAAHNFPFIRQNNAARNQELGIIDQLNDGIRMLQAQAHYVNDTMYLCHTSCDILNAGPLQDQFALLVNWLDQHRYEVVTILLGNYLQGPVEQFLPAIQNSGLERYLYTPPLIPMSRTDWPTTAELILTNKRVVFFIDYMANQQNVPYILDEFSQIWETPFSPQDPNFPCTVQRPPDLNDEDIDKRMYLVNHNLNVDFSTLGIEILVPNVASINETNAVSGFSSLGLNAEQCTADWGRRPNFLLVDFYNYGSSPGSVFEVAAQMNNVTYRGGCCGSAGESGASSLISGWDWKMFWLSSGITFLALFL